MCFLLVSLIIRVESNEWRIIIVSIMYIRKVILVGGIMCIMLLM